MPLLQIRIQFGESDIGQIFCMLVTFESVTNMMICTNVILVTDMLCNITYVADIKFNLVPN